LDTHSHKHKYGTWKEWLSLTGRVARAVTIPEVARHVVEGLLQCMGVERAGVFLLEGNNARFCLTRGEGFEVDEYVFPADRAFLRYISKHKDPINIKGKRSLGKQRTALLDPLRAMDVRIVAPMVARDQVLGFLIIGAKVSGRPFYPDDYDLCHTVAAQAATVIMNARMVEDLAHGREIRAFADMSSFVIHDIKNCANTLSLIAYAQSNLHNPAFQQDAIRTIRRSVEKMHTLVRRLSGVEQFVLRREYLDLNDLVRNSLEALPGASRRGIRIETKEGAVPRIFGDAEQLESVIHNLVMNAIESVDGKGEVRIETFYEEGEVLLVVSDNGCGMPSEFLRHSLFRPFKSTKGGLGIGLYQCKQIARAHGGWLSVDSAEGVGTTCVLRLPFDGETDVSEMSGTANLSGSIGHGVRHGQAKATYRRRR